MALLLVAMPGAPSSVLAQSAFFLQDIVKTPNVNFRCNLPYAIFILSLNCWTRNPDFGCLSWKQERDKKLLVAKGIATRKKNATSGSWPYY